MVLITLMGLPIRLIRWPIGLLYGTINATSHRSFDLPPAGLDETKADLISFALRQTANTDQERAIADQWLSALEISQVAISRLIAELESVDFQLKFWTNRAEKGGHYWFSLTRHGPLAFFKQLARLRPGRSHGGNTTTNTAATTAATAGGYREMSASELVEKRILVFRLLRCSLCEALAKVQSAVGRLHLKDTSSTSSSSTALQQQRGDGGGGGSEESEATGSQDPSPSTPLPPTTSSDDLFINARHCIIQAMVGVTQAFDDLDASAARALEHIIPAPTTVNVDVDTNNAGQQQQQQQRQYGDVLHFSRPDGKYLKDALSKILKLPQQQGLHRHHQGDDNNNNDGFVTPSTTKRPPASHSLTISKKAAAAASTSASTVGDIAMPPFSQDTKTAAAFREAQRAVGISGRLPSKDCTVREVLSFAKSTAQKLQSAPLIELPRWLKAPTTAQRHWIALTVGGALTGYGVLFLYRHSRLSGSRDLDNWAQQSVSLVGSAWKEHVIMPLDRVRGELFDTFRRRPAIVTLNDYEAERDSLQRMLNEFKADHHSRNSKANSTNIGTTDGTTTSSAMADAGMDILMRSYETQLRSPLRSLVGGDLARCVLIQVQKVKTDTQAAMLEIDQILRANELSISLVAAIPAFIVAGALVYGLSGYLTPTAPDPRREALPLRMALIDAERALQSIMIITNKDNNDTTSIVVMSEEAEGEFIFRLGQAWEEARSLFRKHRGLLRSGDAEWERMRSDMLELAAPPEFVRWEDKAGIAQRMMRNYAVLQR